MSRRVLLLVLLLCLAAAPRAQAAWFPAEPLEPPSAGVLRVGGVDVARDGTGAVVYLRNVAGRPHVFLSRLAGGAWTPPERVDVGLDAAAAEDAVVAAADGNRAVVAWISDGRLYGSFLPGGSPDAPLSPPQLLFDGAARAPDVDMGINGTAYVTFTAGGSDVRAARLLKSEWAGVPSVLDIDPAATAGDGPGRPRVAVSADGNAVAVWGETGPDAVRRVFGRRLTGLTPSVAPQELSVAELGGAPGGSGGDVDLDIEDDGSFAWAVFRQEIGGVPRAIARRLVGSLWEPAVAVDAGGPVAAPRIAISGRGSGIAAVQDGAGAIRASLLELDAFGGSQAVGAGSAGPGPAVAAGERDEQAVAWVAADASVRARYRPVSSPFAAEAVLSSPAHGPVAADGGLEAGESRLGDVAVAFVQAGPQGRAPMVAVYDRPAGRPWPLTAGRWQPARPRLKWRAATDLWGTQSFDVYVDGRRVATTTRPEVRLPVRLAEGRHRWYVVNADARGQGARMASARSFTVDARRPRLRVARLGRVVRVIARDRGPSGLARLKVEWGDGSRTRVGSPVAVHRYGRGGRASVVARAVDRAGNVRRLSVQVRLP